MNMKEVSKHLKLTQPAVHKWFIGETTPSIPNLVALAELMRCDINEAYQAITRSVELYTIKRKLPYNLMIHKDMLIEELATARKAQTEELPIL